MIRSIALLLAFLLPSGGRAFAADTAPTAGVRTIAAWVAELDSESAETRARALDQLSGKAAQAKSAIPAVTRLLADKQNAVAFAAIRLLGEFGPDALDSLPALKKLSQEGDRHPFRQLQIAESMLAITRGADKEVVRFALPLKTIKVQSPVLNEDVVRRYPLQIAGPLTELLSDQDPVIRARAAEALGLFALAPYKEPTKSYLVLAGETGSKIAPALDAALSDQDPAVRAAAAVSLAAIQPESADRFVPAILESLEQHQIDTDIAGRALRPFWAKAVAPLIELLSEPKEEYRLELSGILAGFGPNARPALSGALSHKDPKVRMGVAYALHRLGKAASLSIPDLVGALGDKNPGVRLEVAEAIAAIDLARAQPTVPALIELLSQKNAKHRERAAIGLGVLRELAKEAVPALVAALGDESLSVRLTAAYSLVAIDPAAAAPAVPVLLEIGFGKKYGSAEMAATALGRIGPGAKDAMPKLRELLHDPETTIAAAAALAMVRIDPSAAREAVAVLTAILTDGKKPRRHVTIAMRALGEIGRDAESAVPALTKLLSEPTRFDRPEAAAALLRIDPENAAGAAYFREQLQSKGNSGLFEVAEALEGMGAVGRKFLPELLKLLRDKSEDIRAAAAELLGAIGPAAKDALPAIREQLAQEKDGQTKWQMERAIKRIDRR